MEYPIDKWLVRICGHEGGYSNRNSSEDPGGETKWGISKRSYPYLDIENLTLEDAVKIYKHDFIEPLTKISIPSAVVYQLLDFGVHSGITTAKQQLQKQLKLKPDGIFGPKTMEKINNASLSDLAMHVISARIKYMTSLRNWHPNSRGWALRMAYNIDFAIEDTD